MPPARRPTSRRSIHISESTSPGTNVSGFCFGLLISIVERTKHGELTLDQIAELQPGLGTLMRDVSDRYWIAYYAAKGGNWELAAYQLRGVRSLFKKGNLTRPRYKAMVETYTKQILDPLDEHVAAKNFAGF